MPLSDPIRIIKKEVDVFDKFDVKYLVGGSLASSLYGIPRATQDVDIEMIQKAVASKSSFNIIEKENIFKVDIFVMGYDEASFMEISRRVSYDIANEKDNKQSICICGAEDIIAHKLYWYNLGECVSERQWIDVLNVLKIQKNKLNNEYLKQICSMRGVFGLLEKAMKSF